MSLLVAKTPLWLARWKQWLCSFLSLSVVSFLYILNKMKHPPFLFQSSQHGSQKKSLLHFLCTYSKFHHAMLGLQLTVQSVGAGSLPLQTFGSSLVSVPWTPLSQTGLDIELVHILQQGREVSNFGHSSSRNEFTRRWHPDLWQCPIKILLELEICYRTRDMQSNNAESFADSLIC